jgi:hypothetical protein
MKTLVFTLTLAILATVAQADPKAAYKEGYQNALLYWSNGVTVTSTYDIENTAETRAYRHGYQKAGPDRDAFIRGWCDGTDKLLHRQ